MLVIILATTGTGEYGLQVVVRATARVHYLWFLFLAAFGRRALLDPFYRPIALALAAAFVFRLAGPTLAHPVVGAAPASRS